MLAIAIARCPRQRRVQRAEPRQPQRQALHVEERRAAVVHAAEGDPEPLGDAAPAAATQPGEAASHEHESASTRSRRDIVIQRPRIARASPASYGPPSRAQSGAAMRWREPPTSAGRQRQRKRHATQRDAYSREEYRQVQRRVLRMSAWRSALSAAAPPAARLRRRVMPQRATIERASFFHAA